MDIANERNESFLEELCSVVDGDVTVQVSMYDVGAAIGMDRDEAGFAAEDLIVDGLVELVSLSGGVSITPAGLKVLNKEQGEHQEQNDVIKLGDEPILDEEKSKAVAEILQSYRDSVQNSRMSFQRLEEIILDIKTVETQLLSPRPKNSIIKAVLKVLANYASEEEGLDSELKLQLEQMIGA